MKRSLRFELASRYAAAVALGIALVATIGYLVLRDTLDRQINASLISVASIQAASVTDDPTGEMHFHEWGVTAAEAESLGDLNRYAQIWSESGESLLRSQYLTHDLPLDERALSEAAAGEFAWSEARLDTVRVRSIYYPLGRLGSSHERHIIQVAAPLSARDRTIRTAGLFLVGIVLVVVFFVTSSDSGSLVVDHLTSGGKLDSPTPQRVFWAMLLTVGFMAAEVVAETLVTEAMSQREAGVAWGASGRQSRRP